MARVEGRVLTIEGSRSFDEAVRDAQIAVDSEGATRAAVFDAHTGEILADISPLPQTVTSKSGYTAAYANAWDGMMARREKRALKGDKSATDA